MRLVRPLLLVLAMTSAVRAGAQAAGTGTTVTGVVRDTLSRTPLRGAWVQLAARDSGASFARTVATDSLGRYSIDGVPPGNYALGFFHGLLDSLGVEPSYRALRVRRERSLRMDLSTPSDAALTAAVCGPRPVKDRAGDALVIGRVRDAEGRAPVAGAKVTGEWLDLTLRKGKLERHLSGVEAVSSETGWFALCRVPRGGTMVLRASRGADTTDRFEFEVAAKGIVRRELFLGAAQTVVTAGGSTPDDTSALPARVMRSGSARLRGTVRTADGQRPLANAIVRIADGPSTRVNEAGEFTLVNAPAGTRMLQVRAVGYFPVNRAVDLVAGAPPEAFELVTLKAMLDTVKVVVERVNDRSQGGFDRRRQMGLGRFLTTEQIERRGDLFTSDLFRMLPGVKIDGSGFERALLVRGPWGYCRPAFYVDGLYMFDASADDVDGWVTPKHIKGIEIYMDPYIPAEFQRALSGCGAIVIWTK